MKGSNDSMMLRGADAPALGVDDFMGRVTMPEYNRCMEATALEPGGRPASAPAWISPVYQAREIEIVENIAYASVSGRCARMNERM